MTWLYQPGSILAYHTLFVNSDWLTEIAPPGATRTEMLSAVGSGQAFDPNALLEMIPDARLAEEVDHAHLVAYFASDPLRKQGTIARRPTSPARWWRWTTARASTTRS